MKNNFKVNFLKAALFAALFHFSLSLFSAIEIETETGAVKADFTLFNISGYPVLLKYTPSAEKSSAGSKWLFSLDSNIQADEDSPIVTANAYCSSFYFILNENNEFESSNPLAGKLEYISPDFTLTSNIGEKLTYNNKGELITIQAQFGSITILNRKTGGHLEGWKTSSEKIKTFSADLFLHGKADSSRNVSTISWNEFDLIALIKSDNEYKFNYTDNNILNSIEVNGIERFTMEYDESGRLIRLKEPGHDYAITYDEDGKLQTLVDSYGENIYAEYDTQTINNEEVKITYIWNLSQSSYLTYKYADDRVEITESPIDSNPVLFGTIDRKTGIRTMKNILGDELTVLPGTDASFSVNASMRGFTPYSMKALFGSITVTNKNSIEYFKDIISLTGTLPSESRIQNNGIVRDSNKNITGIVIDGIDKLNYYYSEDGLTIEKSITPSGDTIIYAYDKEGRVVQAVNSLGNKISFKYNSESIEVTYPDGAKSTFINNDQNLPVEVNDPMGRKMLIEYDSNRVPYFVELSSFDTQQITASLDEGIFCIESKLFGMWFFLDNFDRTITRFSPAGRAVTYTYNSDNLIISVADDEEILVKYSYNQYQQITEAASPVCSLKYDYDSYGRLIDKTYLNDISFHINYDMSDNISSIEDSEGFLIKYSRAKGGLISSVSSDKTGRFNISYTPSGMIEKITYPNKIELNYKHDVEDKVIKYSVKFPDGKQTTSIIDYDKVGNVVRIKNNDSAVNYKYDELGYLSAISDSSGNAVKMKFDLWGNLLELGKNSSVISSPSRITINSLDMDLDEFNSVTSFTDSGTVYALSYDWNNRLQSVSVDNTSAVEFEYHPMSSDIYSVTQAKKQTKYFYLNNQLYSTKDSTERTLTRYIHLPGTKISLALIRPDGVVEYTIPDIFSSITDLTDKNGKITASRRFNSLGMLKTADSLNIPYGYGNMFSFNNGAILFSENGPVLVKAMRTLCKQAQLPGQFQLDFSNKLSFMEFMPLTTINLYSSPITVGTGGIDR